MTLTIAMSRLMRKKAPIIAITTKKIAVQGFTVFYTAFMMFDHPSRVHVWYTMRKDQPNVSKLVMSYYGFFNIFPQMKPLAQSLSSVHRGGYFR